MNDTVTNLWASLVFFAVLFVCSATVNVVQYNRVRDEIIQRHQLQDRIWYLEEYIQDNNLPTPAWRPRINIKIGS